MTNIEIRNYLQDMVNGKVEEYADFSRESVKELREVLANRIEYREDADYDDAPYLTIGGTDYVAENIFNSGCNLWLDNDGDLKFESGFGFLADEDNSTIRGDYVALGKDDYIDNIWWLEDDTIEEAKPKFLDCLMHGIFDALKECFKDAQREAREYLSDYEEEEYEDEEEEVKEEVVYDSVAITEVNNSIDSFIEVLNSVKNDSTLTAHNKKVLVALWCKNFGFNDGVFESQR